MASLIQRAGAPGPADALLKPASSNGDEGRCEPAPAIRRATIADIPQVHALIALNAKTGAVLPRTLENLYTTVREFQVCVDADTVIGMCALHVSNSTLAEIRSLCVDDRYEGRGIGSALTQASINEARRLGLGTVFALTYRVKFFQRLGFTVVEKSTLPQKIWTDCVHCHKFPTCDETALILRLQETPDQEGAASPPLLRVLR